MPLLYLCIAWLAGIFTGPWTAFPWEGIALTSFAALSLAFLWRSHWPLPLAGLGLALILLGNGRYQASLPPGGPGQLSFYNDHGTLELQGWVEAEPEVRDRTTRLRFSTSQARVKGRWLPVQGSALLVVPRYPEHSYGEELVVVGKAESPTPLADFDYPGYLARQGIYTVMAFPKVKTVGKEGGFPPLRWLLEFKGMLSQALVRSLPEPQAALARGILLGQRATIPKELREAFNRSGTAHIIAISGYHVGLIAGYLLLVSRPLVGRRHALLLSLLGIALYTVLVGMNPPVVRAALMGSIFVLGSYLGRQRNIMLGLLLAAALMTAFQPLVLWDVSFQLSFAATGGLVLFRPTFQQWLQRLWPIPSADREGLIARLQRSTMETLAITLSAMVAILPILLVDFHRLPLVSPLANLLVLPALPWIMASGALVAGLGLVWTPLAQVVGWVAWLFLTYMIRIVEFLGGLPGVALEVAGFSTSLALACYLLLALGWWRWGRKAASPW
jgi:competence protein ComEC